MSVRLHVKYCYPYLTLISLEFSTQIFEKHWNIMFSENASGGSGVVPCGRTDIQTDIQTDTQTDTQTDITKLMVAFRNFANSS
jgi:hypothetical protein